MKTTTATNTEWQEPTADQIAAWKKEFNCKEITVFAALDDRDNTRKKAYFRPPGLVDLQRAAASESSKKGTNAESIFNNCRLACHPDVLSYEPLKLGMILQIPEISTAAEVEVGKL